MSEELRGRVAAVIRRDLQDEAEAGFPLLRRFPDSETARVPEFFAGLSAEERESLLDALASNATHLSNPEHHREREQAFPAIRGLKYLKPLYPSGDWYGGRPKKAKLKKAVTERLAGAGFARSKREAAGSSDWMKFAHRDSAFPGVLSVWFDPGFPRQIDYGFRAWLRPDLLAQFPSLGPRDIIPAISNLNYEILWRCEATSNPICWDVITEANLEETLDVLMETLQRLAALAKRINRLEIP